MIPIRSMADTLGGPGVTHIFVHDLTLPEDAEYVKIHPENASFDERALIVARSHDVVCVSRRMDPDYMRFLEHFGIGPAPEHVIECAAQGENDALPLSDRLRQDRSCLEHLSSLMTDRSRVVLNPYAATPSEIDLARELTLLLGLPVSVWGGNPKITHWANDKWHTYMMALELGVPAPPAELVILESIDKEKPPDIAPLQRAVARFSEQTGKAMVRGIRGTSGTTNLVADPVGPKLEEDLRRLVRNRTTNSYMIQPFFNIAASPNIQLFIEPDTGGISCVSVTDQYLDRNLTHRGNLYPSTATTIPHMLRSAHRMAKGLRDKGYTGLAGFDFVEHVDPETGRTVHFLAEINARVNAATYPCSLMERIARRQLSRDGPIPGAFFSSHIRTRARSFREFLDIHGDRIFDWRRGCAMVPFYTGALDYGACGVVVFGGSRNEVMALYREIERVS